MTKQEVFETVARHLFAQGRQAMTLDAGCMYRGPDDTKCAVGCLIPDEMYSPDMEFKAVAALVAGKDDLGYFLPDVVLENQGLLTTLQGVHDSSGNWEDQDFLKVDLIHAGKRYGLNTEFLNDLTFPESK